MVEPSCLAETCTPSSFWPEAEVIEPVSNWSAEALLAAATSTRPATLAINWPRKIVIGFSPPRLLATLRSPMRAGQRAGRAIGLAQSTDAGRCDRPIFLCLNPRANIAVLKKSCAKWRQPRTRARRTTSSLNNYPAILFADYRQRTPEQAAREGPSRRNSDITAAAENRRSMHFLRVALSFRGDAVLSLVAAGCANGATTGVPYSPCARRPDRP